MLKLRGAGVCGGAALTDASWLVARCDGFLLLLSAKTKSTCS